MDEEVAREKADEEFERKREEMKRKDEEKTGKNRRRREKAKKKKERKDDGKEDGKDGEIKGASKTRLVVARGPERDEAVDENEDGDGLPATTAEDVGVTIHDDD